MIKSSEPAKLSPEYADLRSLIRRMISSGLPDLNGLIHSEVDGVLYEEVLNHVGGHQTQAAELLGISRTTFRTRLQALGMAVGKSLKNTEE